MTQLLSQLVSQIMCTIRGGELKNYVYNFYIQLQTILKLFSKGFALCQDTDLDISEKVFEAEFNKLYGDKKEEDKAAAALAAAEKQVYCRERLHSNLIAYFRYEPT